MVRAIALADLLAEHALLVFDLVGSDPALDAARKLWKWIERERKQRFSKRECWHPLRGTFKRVLDIEPAIEVLRETGHITAASSTRLGPGPKGDWFEVHQAVVKAWDGGSDYNHLGLDDQNDQVAGMSGDMEKESGHLGHFGHGSEGDGDWGEL